MELDRPHRPASSSTAAATSDLFICFTSRLSHSSSMRMSSKSILSPGRTDKPPVALSTSLSRRLRSNNGSLKGGQSPMFPPGVNTKKRGCAFENPEPSSPKVTCIGQVRVKTKKQGKKMKMNMKAIRARRSGNGVNGSGDVSFRRVERSLESNEGKNQSWVQIPLTICDALSCFLPCRASNSSSCGSGEGSRGVKQERESSGSCGGAVYRWLVAFHEGGGEEKKRDVELVVEDAAGVGGERVIMEREISRRRSIFDDMDFNVDEICEGGGGGKEENARVSVCVPPKNALLLMRCRSDPVKMSALVNKFWESPPTKEEEEEKEEMEKRRSSVREDERIEAFSSFDRVVAREDENIESFSGFDGDHKKQLEEGEEEEMERFVEKEVEGEGNGVEEEKCGSTDCRDVDQERVSVSVSENEFLNLAMMFEEEDEPDGMEKEAIDQAQPSIEEDDPVEIQETVIGKDSIFDYIEEDIHPQQPLEKEEVAETQSRYEEEEQRSPISNEEEVVVVEEAEEEEEKQIEKPRRDLTLAIEKPVLPDCLLLMMCEPKLSMEVSQETWVCSTDFLRPWLPEGHRQHQLKKLTGAGDEPKTNKKGHKCKKSRVNTEPQSLPPPAAAGLQPPRSSCSFPISMASLIEKKLVSAVAYEPFALKRCKSEPMRTASAKLGAAAQEVACFWKNNKIEPHRPATCGVGAAGVGF